MRGKIGFAGSGEHIVGRMSTDRLQRFAEFRALMSVVDDQRGASIGRNHSADIVCERLSCGTDFIHRALARGTTVAAERERDRLWRQCEAEFSASGYHHPLAPTAVGHDELPNRQRVEEFVGDDKHRSISCNAVPFAHPANGNRCIAQPLALDGFELCACLDQNQLNRSEEIRRASQRAQHVVRDFDLGEIHPGADDVCVGHAEC